ncbi:MAG: DUF4407 domain-containing protein [Mucilaginibacter sp.]|uniref:DUF4407 domain-containing protein n=1 Tax=Mucilaginibacter sp. TaxID=1882438 RepID=UPI0031A9B29B
MRTDWWIRFGCFLTGYKYSILQGCSEVSHRAVKRYTAALLIVSILWAFIGYSFARNYLQCSSYYSVLGALIFVLIILQVERQIIMSEGKGNLKYWVRGAIALIMAVIGSVIIDQIIFREDIAHRQLFEINAQVDSLLPAKQAELKRQVADIDSSLGQKEAEQKKLKAEVDEKPTVLMTNRVSRPVQSSYTTIDTLTKTPVTRMRTTNQLVYESVSVENPKKSMIVALDQQIRELREIKMRYDDRIVKLREEVEQEAKASNGFLYELKLMYEILRDSVPALVVWLLWAFLLFGIEVFILVNKLTHVETDYDVCIAHHMELHKRKLKLLAGQLEAVGG